MKIIKYDIQSVPEKVNGNCECSHIYIHSDEGVLHRPKKEIWISATRVCVRSDIIQRQTTAQN